MSNILWLSTYCQGQDINMVEHKSSYETLCRRDSSGYEQYPSLIALVGRTAKSRMIQAIFSAQGEAIPYGPHSQIRLWSEPISRDTSSSVVFVDCELHSTHEIPSARVASAGPEVSRPLRFPESMNRLKHHRAIGLRVYAQVLVPLLSVLCIFAEDVGGFLGVADTLAEMTAFSCQSDTPTTARCRFVVALRTEDCSSNVETARKDLVEEVIRTMRGFKQYGSEEDARREFQSAIPHLSVMIVSQTSSPTERALQLQHTLNDQNMIARAERLFHQRQFSFQHQQAFFEIALDKFADGLQERLSFLRASRYQMPPSENFQASLYELFVLLYDQQEINRTAIPLLSSALVLDSCPPNMHCMGASISHPHF